MNERTNCWWVVAGGRWLGVNERRDCWRAVGLVGGCAEAADPRTRNATAGNGGAVAVVPSAAAWLREPVPTR